MVRRPSHLLVLAAALACNGHGDDDDATGESTGDPTAGTSDGVELNASKAVDVLFVIDNSAGMAAAQQRLADDLPGFVEALREATPDFRIGFTTTDNGNPRCPNSGPARGAMALTSCLTRVDNGEFMTADGDFSAICTDRCQWTDEQLVVRPTDLDGDGSYAPLAWLEPRGNGYPNVDLEFSEAEWTDVLHCYAPQGLSGCGYPSHLEAMYQALERTADPASANFGFLRERSILAVVIVSDRADCSFAAGYPAIFSDNKVFWSDPDEATPAICWAAGVACAGAGPTYSACHSEDYDEQGSPGAAADDAVLTPVAKYIDYVRSIEAARRYYDRDQRVLVSLIAGAPIGYETHDAEIPWADAADPDYQAQYGIGPGCIEDPADMPDKPFMTAVPPVREREFAEAFADDSDRNLSSVCAAGYAPALTALAARVREQPRGRCLDSCIADADPGTEIVEPTCEIFDENLVDSIRTRLPPCVAGAAADGEPAWTLPPGVPQCFALRVDKDGTQSAEPRDDMSRFCADVGYNLEVLILPAFSLQGHTMAFECTLSDDAARDCPKL